MGKISDNRKVAIDYLKNSLGYSTEAKQQEVRLESINLYSENSEFATNTCKWVENLDVEYQDSPIRFDLSRLTMFIDTENKPIALPQIGSGANWVAYHLLLTLALHQHFIQNNRPLPRFIIFTNRLKSIILQKNPIIWLKLVPMN